MVREEAAVIDVGILNINSYAGIGLAALVEAHPTLRLCAVAGHGSAGQTLRALFPAWDGPDLPVLEALPPLDLVFSALPHVAAARAVVPLARAGTRVIDLSADFRLRDPAVYAQWYGHVHPAPDLLPDAIYGLTETDRARIAAATLVANPGCYPTAVGLGLAPALAAGLIDPDAGVIVDAKSGISGAGRTLKTESLFSEADESVAAYGLSGHRHLPEIEQTAAALARGGPGRAEGQPDAGPARGDGPALAGGLAMSAQRRPIDGGVTAPQGFVAGAMACGIKPSGKPDLALVASRTAAAVAGVFTTNRVQAAPGILSQQRATAGRARAVIVNSGNANACTGAEGHRAAERMAAAAARRLELAADEVLVL